MAAPASARALLKSCRAAAVFLLIAAHFSLNLQQNGRTFLDAAAYVGLHEKLPYQYRVLMAPALGALIDVLSLPAASELTRRLPSYIAAAEPAAYFTINTLAIMLSCLLMRAIVRRSLPDRTAARTAIAAYVAMAYLFFCLNPNVAFILPYDTVGLVLSQACILCILGGRRWVLYPLFALATVNRETSLLVIVFLLARAAFGGGTPGVAAALRQRRVWQPALLLSFIWLAIKAVLYVRFAGLPSDEGLRIHANLMTLGRPWQWPAVLPVIACFVLSLRSFARLRDGREWPFVGCLGFMMLCTVGQLIETRVFGDLMVYFSIAVARWWCCWWCPVQVACRR